MIEKLKNKGFEKQISVSNRGYPIIYIDKAKIYTKNNCIVYSQAEESVEKTYNIPYLNASILMLGTGTSITNEAIRLAADNSITVMFVNSLYKISASTDESFNIISSNSEYRINDYTYKISKIFFNEEQKLVKAKELLIRRLNLTELFYLFFVSENIISNEIYESSITLKNDFIKNINNATSISILLASEGSYTKKLYKVFAINYKLEFKRDHEFLKKTSSKIDEVNNYLTLSNYLMYGMAASALTVLNIPFAFAFLHGKTRRGALVFDIADLFKDGISIPLSFYFIKNDFNESSFRKFILEILNKYNVYSKFFNEIQSLLKDSE